MQFKHPELLWGLFLLLIPIIIHLFQLRRFQKTPFTNVKFLKKVIAESRKSNTLKKWLLLATRLLLFTAIIIAFAQPFCANKKASKEIETVIYLDNSFSMQSKKENIPLLKNAIQELLKQIPERENFSLFTNDRMFRNVSLEQIKNDLLALEFTEKQLNLSQIQLKAHTFFSKTEASDKNILVLSDFQQRILEDTAIDSVGAANLHIVKLMPDERTNISIDSTFLPPTNNTNIELHVLLKATSGIDNTPVSLYNDDKLIAKTSAVFEADGTSEIIFSLPKNEVINGTIAISDNGLTYDNTLYFAINKKEKIKVLSINGQDDDFLKRIYTDDEFDFVSFNLKELDYSALDSKNLIVLNELDRIPVSLQTALTTVINDGSGIVIIPSLELDVVQYNRFLNRFGGTSFVTKVNSPLKVSDIAFDHPLYRNVFEKKVTNFQYPTVNAHYTIRSKEPKALRFQNSEAFLVGDAKGYVFTSSLQTENSNFKNSPLIVPTFYTMGLNSLRLPSLYIHTNSGATIDIPITLTSDEILTIASSSSEFIPKQRTSANKVQLQFEENPIPAGIYTVRKEDEPLMNISFNYNRKESNLNYLDLEAFNATTKQNTISSVFTQMKSDRSVKELWKWFVMLALLFLCLEILVQKFLK